MPSEAFVATMADVWQVGSFLAEDDDGFLSLTEGEEEDAYLLLRLLTRRFTEEPLRSELLLIVVEELSE